MSFDLEASADPDLEAASERRWAEAIVATAGIALAAVFVLSIGILMYFA